METVSHQFVVMSASATVMDAETGMNSMTETTFSSPTWDMTDESSLYSGEQVTSSWPESGQTAGDLFGHYAIVNGIENVTLSADSIETLSSDCDSFVANYGILSGTVCSLVLISGVITCFFGM